jgi:hypothetical protein
VPRNHASPEPRRSADRILDTAEGVLVALRRYHINQAFFELAQTAKRHGITTVNLADALVALAQRQPTGDCDARAVEVARETWAFLLDRNNGTKHAHTDPREAL